MILKLILIDFNSYISLILIDLNAIYVMELINLTLNDHKIDLNEF